MTRRAALLFFSAAVLVVFDGTAVSAERKDLTVFWTGETHAMLTPCACPYTPEGGIARRATAAAAERAEGPVILVDAGGWAAGGLYDEYTEGREVDALRTETSARALALMEYDGVALADEELAWGPEAAARWGKDHGLPLVSANLYGRESGERLAPAFRIVERGGWRVAVVGLTPPEIDLLIPEAARSYKVTSPIEAAREAVSEARGSGVDAVIVLSPLGEEMSERLAREVEGIDLIVSAGRRTSKSHHFLAGGALVVKFHFQGLALGRARFSGRAGAVEVRPLDPLKLGPKIPDDPKAMELVKHLEDEIREGARRRVLEVEVFKMALCPYAPGTEKAMAEVISAIPERVNVRVTHIIRRDAKGGFESLHGKPEIDEARRQVAIFRFYPSKYWDYVAWRARNLLPSDGDWQKACRRLEISVARVKGAVLSGESDDILRRHAFRTQRLRVTNSPTLYLGGRRFEIGSSRLGVLRVVCSALPGGSKGVALCKDIPYCFTDADCREPGFTGECIDAGTKDARCVFYRAVKVPVVVVRDPEAVYSPVGRIMESLRVFFPGLEERRVDHDSPEGRELVRRYSIERLPAYVIGKDALKERKIDSIRKALVPVEDRLVLAPALAGSHQDITRPRDPGRVDLFLAPHSTAAAEALEEVLDMWGRPNAPPVSLRSAVRRDGEGRLAAQGGLAELEAMLREIAVAELHPDKLVDYLRARAEDVGSSYWRSPILKVGLDPAVIRRAAESGRTLAFLDADAQELAELGAGGAVVMLVSNQELVPVGSRADLRHALEGAMELAPDSDALRSRDLSAERTRRAVPLLIRALDAAPEAARGRIRRGLVALTGEDFGTDAERWKAWLRERVR